MELKKLLEEVRVGERTVFEVAKDGKSLTVEQRKLLPEEPRAPLRAESPPRAHEFLSARSLADYLARYGSKRTVVFADPGEEEIHAVIDEEAKDGFQVVSMKPKVHPLWQPWLDAAGQAHEIKDFARFVLENRRAILSPDGRELALTLSQVRASVSVEIMAGRGRNSVNGIVVRSRVQSGQEQSDLVDLPDTLTVRVPLFVDTQPKDVEVDLCVEATADGGVSVLVTAGTVEEARVRAFEEMVAQIREGTAALGAVLTFGQPKHAAWSYLREIDGPAVSPR